MVMSPNTSRGKDRDIELSMYFGGTEITATAWDISSGNKAQTTLDFFLPIIIKHSSLTVNSN